MKLSRPVLVLLSNFLIGATSATWSEVGCGCDNYNDSIASVLGVSQSGGLGNPRKIEAAVAGRFRNASVASEDLDQNGGRACSDVPAKGAVSCTYWLWSKPGVMRALVLVVHYGPQRRFRSVHASYSEENSADITRVR